MKIKVDRIVIFTRLIKVSCKSRISLLILMICSFSLLLTSNVDIQIKRLEYIQMMIEQKREEILQTQAQKDLTLQQKNRFQSNLESCQSRIRDLTNREVEVVEDLIVNQHNMDNTQKRLQATLNVWQKQVSQFYFNRRINGRNREKALIEEHYFPNIIIQTRDCIVENNELLALIQTNIENSRLTQREIHKQKESEQQVRENLQGQISHLAVVVESITSEGQRYLDEVTSLENNRIALEALITHLQSDGYQVSYKFTKDKLSWPVKGKVINHFGKIIDKTYQFEIINNGIDIVTNDLQQVSAVDFGIVVFAETFRNYGKMVIIDHRNGYFSLYAHNNSLNVTKGDVVDLGQPIAEIGRNNGNDSYLLHFEIRRHNKPVNPLDYLE